MKHRWVAALLLLSVLFAACGDDDGTEAGAGAPEGEDSEGGEQGNEGGDAARVGMVLPGPSNDGGFNEAHYSGLELAAEELGVEIIVQENVVDPEARIDAVRNLAVDNDLVIGVGGQFAEAGTTIAGQFPDVDFAIINGEPGDAENLHIYGVRQGVPAYIAGVVATEMTNVGKVGYLGGELIPPTTQSDSGMAAGVEDTDDSIEYVPTIVGSFNDPAKAKDAAAAQIASGVDIMFALIDAGFPGVLQAVEESGEDVLLMDAIFPRCDQSDLIIGTAILNSPALVKQIVEDHLAGDMPADPQFFGVEDAEIQRFELCPGHSTPELEQLVEDTTAGIVDGSIELPDDV